MDFPETNELVLIRIKKIMPYGAFCILEEYPGLEAFLHISEIAPRWIKNIHEFISEGQRLVAKVINSDPSRHQVDVSLKRVNEEEKRRKLEMVQIEKKTNKLIEVAIKNSKAKLSVEEVRERIEKVYDHAYDLFEELSEGKEKAFKGITLPVKLKKELITLAQKSIKKKKAIVFRDILLSSTDPRGIEKIKGAFSKKNIGTAKVHYLGAPKYRIYIESDDYKTGEKAMQRILSSLEKYCTKNNCTLSVLEEAS